MDSMDKNLPIESTTSIYDYLRTLTVKMGVLFFWIIIIVLEGKL
jgi:hypothetical protein